MSFVNQEQGNEMSGDIGSTYSAEVDEELAGLLDAYDVDPEGMAGEVVSALDLAGNVAPMVSARNLSRLTQAGTLATQVMAEAAKRQSEWGTFPNYPTTVTLTGGAAGTFDSTEFTLRPLGSGTSDIGRPLTLISILGFSSKTNGSCECFIRDILKNGAPQFGSAGTSNGGFYFERVRPENLQGPYVRPITMFGLSFQVGDTYVVRADLSAAGTYRIELDFCVKPFEYNAQRAPSVIGNGGSAISLARAIRSAPAARGPITMPRRVSPASAIRNLPAAVRQYLPR